MKKTKKAESPRCIRCEKKVHACKCQSKIDARTPDASSTKGVSGGCSYRAPIRPQE